MKMRHKKGVKVSRLFLLACELLLKFCVIEMFILEQVQAVQHQQGNDISSTTSTLSCKDELGNNVDWFIAYKLPILPQSSDPLFQQGSGYFYILSENKKSAETNNKVTTESKWERSSYGIHENKSILGITTQAMYSNDNELAYFLYNDQPPNHPAVVRDGHTKGIVFAKSDGGFWLPHSVPHFPIPGTSFGYPIPGGLENGQMFFCLSLNASQIDIIGNALKYTKPRIYDYKIPEALKSMFPMLLSVAQFNSTVKKAPWFNTFSLDANELDVTVFAKGPKFRREIYADWISPKYQTSLDVQSWLNGAHPFLSNCTSEKFPVLNVLDKSISGQNFSTLDDHSKWAVGIDQPITCVGDLNRMKPQKTRGGLALCVRNEQIWSAFKSAVLDTQPCQKFPVLQIHSKYSKKKNRHVNSFRVNSNHSPPK